MSAWGKVNGIKDSEKILFLADTKSKLSQQIGWMAGMGDRNGRWAMIVDYGTISYAEQEQDPRKVTVRTCLVILSNKTLLMIRR